MWTQLGPGRVELSSAKKWGGVFPLVHLEEPVYLCVSDQLVHS